MLRWVGSGSSSQQREEQGECDGPSEVRSLAKLLWIIRWVFESDINAASQSQVKLVQSGRDGDARVPVIVEDSDSCQ